jgi:hypothetical protein
VLCRIVVIEQGCKVDDEEQNVEGQYPVFIHINRVSGLVDPAPPWNTGVSFDDTPSLEFVSPDDVSVSLSVGKESFILQCRDDQISGGVGCREQLLLCVTIDGLNGRRSMTMANSSIRAVSGVMKSILLGRIR